MKTLSTEEIEDVWEHQCGLDEEQSSALSLRFLQAQPALGVYLLACDEQLGDQAAESQLLPLALACWETMTAAHADPLKEVQPETVERAEAVNFRMLEKLETGSEFDQQGAAESLVKDYNQAPLLMFGLEVLMIGNEDTPELAREEIGLELLWLKTIIDCLDQ